jgi:uncharacterized protein HemY
MNEFGDTEDTDTANTVAWACAVIPAVAGDLKPHVALARRALAADEDSPYYLSTLGAILIRAGQPVEAVQILKRAVESDKEGELHGWCHLTLALAALAQGRAAEARSELGLARRWIDAKERDRKLLWHDRLELNLLRSEVEAALTKHP